MATAKQPAKSSTILIDIEEKLDRGIANHWDLFSAADSADALGRKEIGRYLRIEAHVAAKRRLLTDASSFAADGIDHVARHLRDLARLEQKATDAIRRGDVGRANELHKIAVGKTQLSPSTFSIL